MATSGTTSFSPSIAEICEEAYERAGLEMRSGYDLRTAVRSLNILMLEWGNKGFNMWTGGSSSSVTLVSGTASYNLASDTLDAHTFVLRKGAYPQVSTSDRDTVLPRMSLNTYSGIPNKLEPGLPQMVYVNRKIEPPTVTIWPVINTTGYVLVYFRIRRIEDAGRASTNTLDVPARFIPAAIAGLAYHVAMKRPEVTERVMALKQIYDEVWNEVAGEDRERISARFTPAIPSL